MIKLKALLLTVLIGVAAVGFVYIFLTQIRLVLGILVALVAFIGLRVLYTEVYDYLDRKEAIKKAKKED